MGFKGVFSSVQVTQSCLTLCDPMNHSMPGLPVHHQLLESTQTRVHCVGVMPSNHLILCRPLLPLPSIFPRIRVFSNESALRIRWPKYWSFSFNIIPHFLSFRWTLKTFFRQNVEHHHFLLFSDILHRKTFLSYQIALLSCFSKLSFLSPINISFYI